MRKQLLAFLCLTLAASGPAEAAIIRGDFSGIVEIGGTPFAGPAGSSTATTPMTTRLRQWVPGRASSNSATAYPLLSFVIDGAPVGPSFPPALRH